MTIAQMKLTLVKAVDLHFTRVAIVKHKLKALEPQFPFSQLPEKSSS